MPTQIFPLSEGHFTIGHDKVFHPFNMEKDVLTERPTGSLLVEVQPFVLINDRDIILLDTGLGFEDKDGEKMLVANLKRHNIHPEDVTKILMSHLHKDHAGGLDVNVFSNASIYIYQAEFEYAMEVGMPSYFPGELNELVNCDRVEWLTAAQGTIDGYIHYRHSGGHSKEHIVYKIDTDKGTIFYGGDEAPQYKQMVIKYVAKYDYDGRHAMELRKAWAAEGAAEGWTALFYHDIKQPIVLL